MKNSLYVLRAAAALWLDRALADICAPFTDAGKTNSLPPRDNGDTPGRSVYDVPTTGWSSDEGDRAIKRIVGLCFCVLLLLTLFAQTHHYYQRHPFFHQR